MTRFALIFAASLVLGGGGAAYADDSGHVGVDSLKAQQREQHRASGMHNGLANPNRHAGAMTGGLGCQNQPGCQNSNKSTQ